MDAILVSTFLQPSEWPTINIDQDRAKPVIDGDVAAYYYNRYFLVLPNILGTLGADIVSVLLQFRVLWI